MTAQVNNQGFLPHGQRLGAKLRKAALAEEKYYEKPYEPEDKGLGAAGESFRSLCYIFPPSIEEITCKRVGETLRMTLSFLS